MERFGNLLTICGIQWNLLGKSQEQAKAIFADACKEIARACAESGRPLMIERWDLGKRKLTLESVNPVPDGLLFFPSPTPRRSRW
ncbi:hypothetical protein [Candidatus Methylacidithermus pantelleriae]|uniref:Uncharacterized protein n=1 Tax=Candidatus Methylacidithermus pantelleriae TaxID=2744239 RepID=A0A8J2BSR9_9BACT|nr:hypothetical protein [Candidatus Methylacidithermus pantelleriae]CAF0697488.1 hypothetical protein MPNT_220017 [Candidatus Methylacidithermus pantelleriae]